MVARAEENAGEHESAPVQHSCPRHGRATVAARNSDRGGQRSQHQQIGDVAIRDGTFVPIGHLRARFGRGLEGAWLCEAESATAQGEVGPARAREGAA